MLLCDMPTRTAPAGHVASLITSQMASQLRAELGSIASNSRNVSYYIYHFRLLLHGYNRQLGQSRRAL